VYKPVLKSKYQNTLQLTGIKTMLIGYARVSTADQNQDLQIDALKSAGCQKIYSDHGVSGSTTNRPELDKALADLREGDCLVVWRLDRLGRNLQHLIGAVAELEGRKVQFKSLNESIDTSSANGKLVFNLFCSLAQFERDLIRERTQAGLTAARARGKNGGRPKTLSAAQLKMARTLYDAKQMTVSEICEQIGCSRSTFYKNVPQSA
jgi:DNA invertase Pin-like site-specific DNA recombinase